jgi:hypothetical protein
MICVNVFIVAAALLLNAHAAPFFLAAPPAKGDNGKTGGIFGAGDAMNMSSFLGKGGKSSSPSPVSSSSGSAQVSSGAPKKDAGPGWLSMLGALAKGGSGASLESALGGVMGGRGAEAVVGGTLTSEQWAHPGTGPYPARYLTGISSTYDVVRISVY